MKFANYGINVSKGHAFVAILLAIFLSLQGLMGAENNLSRVQKEVNQLIREPQKPVVKPRLLNKATPSTVRIYISLEKQRAYLFVNNEIAIDAPISSGKRKGMTPMGEFTILEKIEEYQPSSEGNFVDRQGRVVRRGVSAEIDSAPSGTIFMQMPVKFFMRLNRAGVGIHAGMVPGYRASSGAVWMPEETARLFFANTQVGTPVVIGN